MFPNINFLAATAFASLAAAATHRVDVGKNGLAFTPNSTVAAVGDVVEFHYFPKNHSVVQTSFAGPCEFDLPNPFFSGFMPVTAGEGVSQLNPDMQTRLQVLLSY
jgi:plastocyanin